MSHNMSNGENQGSVNSSILCVVYTDGLLKGLQETGVCWSIGIAVHLPMLMTSHCCLQVALDYFVCFLNVRVTLLCNGIVF